MPGTLDWGVGRYESTAERLLPAARVVVERASLQGGEHVLDHGCGTGNAALLGRDQLTTAFLSPPGGFEPPLSV